ncbi:acyl-CoA dehydrogenase family protein [Actinomyces bowdenii]|uniref:Acyl-CoA dehydrogenase n=1 Tax=Actinomyces bowdenii TaxID=131109 RepID=A0A3P1V8W0_9ACTO|nr:acyl-CoA dehydrogenase family protein [Actinomyces bowdenii]RRD30652.1 acyl-CoA dehydrogenase [Actinomyces bowdenii]
MTLNHSSSTTSFDDSFTPFTHRAGEWASEVDAATRSPRGLLEGLGEAGLLDLGVEERIAGSARADDVRAPAALIAALATECMTTAFALWAHRMVQEYLARGGRSPATEEVLAELRAGHRFGATAMAAGLKWLAGVGDLAVRAEPEGEGWRLSGFIPWVSLLLEDSIMVVPARTPHGTVVAWLPVEQVEVSPVTGLLALDATASGSVALKGVVVGPDQVISRDLAAFAQGFKPTMLALQSSFCVGLAQRSLGESEAALSRATSASSAAGSVFAADLTRLREEVAAHQHRWRALVADVGAASAREVLETRLQASDLAVRATRLEATLAGGRGYRLASGAGRRLREAAFLPVQSPSEGHLRWELSSLS